MSQQIVALNLCLGKDDYQHIICFYEDIIRPRFLAVKIQVQNHEFQNRQSLNFSRKSFSKFHILRFCSMFKNLYIFQKLISSSKYELGRNFKLVVFVFRLNSELV